jgi:hypothetical protein
LLCFVGFDAFVLRLARLSRQFQKGNSPKFASRILHSPGPIGPETPDSPDPAPNLKPYILWYWIDMQ